jgi:hypothetical protein
MSERMPPSDDLRRRFLEPPEGAVSEAACPEPERYLRAALGELSAEENRELAEHGAVCPACTLAWKLAGEYAEEAALKTSDRAEGIAEGRVPRARRRYWLPAAAALAAALALVAVLAPWPGREGAPAPVLRAIEQEAIESLVPEGSSLPADAFTLRWSGGPEGSRFALRVTDRRLEHLAGASALDAREYTVPPEALAYLEPGTMVLWQVEATLPDGRRLVSETFATRLE